MLLLAVCIFLPGLLHVASGTGHIEVHFLHYSDDCVEHFGTNLCDPMFSFCLSTPQALGSLTAHNCNYASTGESESHFDNTNNIDMERMTSIAGHRNPWVVQVQAFLQPSVMLVIMVRDADIFEHDHLQTWAKLIALTKWPSIEQSIWSEYTMTQNSYSMRFKIQMYCDPYYFTQRCDKYCKPDNSSAGHYLCEPNTGNKLCLPGWQGPHCSQDIDECVLGFCNTSNCTNTLGSYHCSCLANYSGRNCSVLVSNCQSNPCQNGGVCFSHNSQLIFLCNCTDEWEGNICDVRKNPCQLEPCLNNGSCANSPNGTGYHCTCVYPYTGDNCEQQKSTTISSTTVPNLETTPTSTTATLSSPTTTTTTTTTSAVTTTVAATTTATTISTTVQTSTTTMANRMSTSSELPVVNVQEFRKKDEDNDFQLWYIAIIVGLIIIFIIAIAVAMILIRRRQRKATHNITPPSSPTVSYNGINLAFDSEVYTHVNTSSSENVKQARKLPPVPTQPTSPTDDELFNPQKPAYVEMGAAGATAISSDDYSVVKRKSVSYKGKKDTYTVCMRPESERAQSNDYADFRSLADLQMEDLKTGKPSIENAYDNLIDVGNTTQELEKDNDTDEQTDAAFSFDFNASPIVKVQTSPYEIPPNNASYYATLPTRSTIVSLPQPKSLSSEFPHYNNLIATDDPNDNPANDFLSGKNFSTAGDGFNTYRDDDDDDYLIQEDLAKLRQDVKDRIK